MQLKHYKEKKEILMKIFCSLLMCCTPNCVHILYAHTKKHTHSHKTRFAPTHTHTHTRSHTHTHVHTKRRYAHIHKKTYCTPHHQSCSMTASSVEHIISYVCLTRHRLER